MARPPKHFSSFGPCYPFGEKMAEDQVVFETGAKRSSGIDHLRWDLVPILGLMRVARTAKEGADKYGIGNWLKGIPISNLVNHVINHMYWYLAGDRSEDHPGHAGWGCLAICHMEMVKPEMNDLVYQAPDIKYWAEKLKEVGIDVTKKVEKVPLTMDLRGL